MALKVIKKMVVINKGIFIMFNDAIWVEEHHFNNLFCIMNEIFGVKFE
jgi:hypothetical protein